MGSQVAQDHRLGLIRTCSIKRCRFRRRCATVATVYLAEPTRWTPLPCFTLAWRLVGGQFGDVSAHIGLVVAIAVEFHRAPVAVVPRLASTNSPWHSWSVQASRDRCWAGRR